MISVDGKTGGQGCHVDGLQLQGQSASSKIEQKHLPEQFAKCDGGIIEHLGFLNVGWPSYRSALPLPCSTLIHEVAPLVLL